jgi:hypothetical protein
LAHGGIFAYSTREHAKAGEVPGERNGIFTKHLLRELAEHPSYSVVRILSNVAQAVSLETSGIQTPEIRNDLFGEVFFNGAPHRYDPVIKGLDEIFHDPEQLDSVSPEDAERYIELLRKRLTGSAIHNLR